MVSLGLEGARSVFGHCEKGCAKNDDERTDAVIRELSSTSERAKEVKKDKMELLKLDVRVKYVLRKECRCHITEVDECRLAPALCGQERVTKKLEVGSP